MQTGVVDPNSLDPDPAELSQDSALQGGEQLPLTCEKHKTLRFDDMTADSVIYVDPNVLNPDPKHEHEHEITLFYFCFVGEPYFLLAHIEFCALKERSQRECAKGGKSLIFVTSRPCEQWDCACSPRHNATVHYFRGA
jgi:hypothetical protein